MGNKLRILLFAGYFLLMILITRVMCIVDGKLKQNITILDINDSTEVTITNKPE